MRIVEHGEPQYTYVKTGKVGLGTQIIAVLLNPDIQTGILAFITGILFGLIILTHL